MIIHQLFVSNFNFILKIPIFSTFNIAVLSYLSYFSVYIILYILFEAPRDGLYIYLWRYTKLYLNKLLLNF